jgi:hypothetical protein
VLALFATELGAPRRFAALTWAVLIPASAVAALGCYQYFHGVGGLESQGVYRVFSVFEWTNTLAFFLIVPLGWAAFVIRNAESRRTRLAGWAVFGVLTACEFFTFGRGGWIGALIAVSGPLVIAGPPPRIVASRALAFGSAALVGALVLISWSALGLSARVADIANIQGRAMIWDYVFRRAMDDPIIGHGFWASNALTAQAMDELVSQGIHNSYLMVFFDYGLIGLVLFCGVWLLLLAQLARQIGRFDRTGLRLALAAGFTTLGVLIYSGSGIELVDFAPSMYLWMLLGYALQLTQDHKPAEVDQRENAARDAERQPTLALQHQPH